MMLTGRLPVMAIAFTGTILFAGCYHAQMMRLRATGEKNTSIVLYGNKPLTGERAAGDTGQIVIRVPQGNTTSREFYFGMGNWSDADLEALVDNIDSVIITGSNGIERLNDKSALKTYLQAHCGGFGHNELKLEAK